MRPEKKVTCPFCGEEIDADALQCPKCGNRWDDAEEREAIRVMLNMPGMGEKRVRKLYEAGFRKIKDIEEADLEEILKKAGIPLRVAREVKERVEEKKGIYICPNCGAFVSADADFCPICGISLEGEEELEEAEGIVEKEETGMLRDDLFVEEAQQIYICKVCGAFVSEDMEACPICGAKMPENRAEMPEKVEDTVLEDEQRNIETIRKFFGVDNLTALSTSLPTEDVLETTTEIDICQNCGAFVPPEAETCPVCGASLVPEISEEEERKVEEEALLALQDLKEELIGGEIPDVEEEREEVSFVCPECGAEVPENAERCPNCGAVFAEEEEGEEEIVLSIGDVIEMPEIPSSLAMSNPPQEEIKAEVDSLLEQKEDEKAVEMEKFELSMELEGGLDEEIAPVETRKEKKPIIIPQLEIPRERGRKQWRRVEDYIMAATSIASILMASEYLLTYPFVTQPKIAYGSSALSIFVSLSFLSFMMMLLDRKEIFSKKWPLAFIIAPILMLFFIPVHWHIGMVFQRALISDIMLLSFCTLLFIALFLIFREDWHPFLIFSIGLYIIAVHSIFFVFDFYSPVPYYDPIPVYGTAIFGGAVLSLGVYMRIDIAVRAILSTRDVLLGHKYYMSGEYEKAMKYYTRAIERKRGDESGYDLAYYSKGTALLTSGNSIEALKYLNRSIKDNPENEMAWNNRGIALAKLGLEDAALKSYERAIEINPNYEVAWNNKGNLLAKMGRYEEALKCYERALKINPDYRDAWMNKGYVLIKLDRYREAKECAEHILPSSKEVKRRASRIPG